MMTLVTGRRRRNRKRDILCALLFATPTPPMSVALPLMLSESDVPADPLALFADWYAVAVAAQLPEPGAMTLATATPDGSPSARVVLLRGYDERGLVFYTNYQSRKAAELD